MSLFCSSTNFANSQFVYTVHNKFIPPQYKNYVDPILAVLCDMKLSITYRKNVHDVLHDSVIMI